MYCIAENRLYLKANGEVPCWCAFGENKILHRADEKTDFIKSVLFGDQYVHMRDSLRNGILPWPDICARCFILKRDDPFVERPFGKRKLNSVQIEPSFLCNLDCLACFPGKSMRKKTKSPPYNMPFNLFKKMVDDIHNAGLPVHFFDFQGRGEPLMNKDVWKMASYARERFPNSISSLITNGNFNYNPELIDSGLSELWVAIDGCFHDSYKRYRKGGDIGKAFKFVKECADGKRKHKKEFGIIWKYVLFAHNDSEEELIAAQKKAVELGVDTLLFELTAWLHKSRPSRFFDKRELENFPVLDTKGVSLKVITPQFDYITQILNIRERATFDYIKETEPKRMVVFGSAPEKIVKRCIEELSESQPGTSIDMVAPHEFDAKAFNGLKVNLIRIEKGVPMSEDIIDPSLFRENYHAGIICSSEPKIFPGKFNVFHLAKKLNCQRVMSYTSEKSFEVMIFG